MKPTDQYEDGILFRLWLLGSLFILLVIFGLGLFIGWLIWHHP